MPGCCYLGRLKKKTKEVLLFGIRDFAIFAQENWGSPPLREVELKEIELAKYRRNTSCGETECFRYSDVDELQFRCVFCSRNHISRLTDLKLIKMMYYANIDIVF